MSSPVAAAATTTLVTSSHEGKSSARREKKLQKEEERRRKKEEKRLRKQEKHELHKERRHEPATAAAASVVHKPELIVEHAPLVEREMLEEHPIERKRERHIQPIIHETEHHVQPIIKVETTTERPIVERDVNVMLPPIMEPPRALAEERAEPHRHRHLWLWGRRHHHRHPAEMSHPVEPGPTALPMMVAPRETHMWRQPERVPDGAMAMIDDEMPISRHLVAPMTDSEVTIPIEGAEETPIPHEGKLIITEETTSLHTKGGVGQRLIGVVKSVPGVITRHPTKKETKTAGKEVDSTTVHAATSPTTVSMQ